MSDSTVRQSEGEVSQRMSDCTVKQREAKSSSQQGSDHVVRHGSRIKGTEK